MPFVVPNWLADHVAIAPGTDVHAIAEALVKVGVEEEEVHGAEVTGPLVVGKVLAKTPEPQKNGKTINWCLVDVGPEHNTNTIAGVTAEQLALAGAPATGARGIVCGAHNFDAGDYVVVALPGTVLPGPFPIAARKTYGHVSDGMICSTAELGMPDDGQHGIIVLAHSASALTSPVVEPGAGQAGGGAAPTSPVVEPGAVAPTVETTPTEFKESDLTPGQDAIALLGLGEETLEVNVTPDRGYQFSYRGLAREYGLSTGAKFTDPVIALHAEVPATSSDAFPVEIDDDAPIRGNIGCDRFVTRVVTGIDPTAPTPKWMKQRLEQSGMRSISLAVDITNYVMLDLGQPIHAYDLAKIDDPIVVRRANSLGFGPGEKLTTLDGVERTLDDEDLLITDSGDPAAENPTGAAAGSRVLGLAGVMGGASTEVSDTTTSVLIEAAHFDPVSVARTARRHKLPTEAAKRFERGVDPELPPVAAQMVVDLLVKYAGGEPSQEVGDEDATVKPQPITLPLDLPSRIVGLPYSRETIVKTLESIGCEVTPAPVEPPSVVEPGALAPTVETTTPSVVEPNSVVETPSETLTVTPPTWRPDLTEPVDLVEEIVRIDGYGKVPSALPAAPGGRGLTSSQRLRRSIARTLAEAGLVEVLTYPFVGPKDYEAFRTDPTQVVEPARSASVETTSAESSSRNPWVEPGRNHRTLGPARLANPLSSDRPDLRDNILITLLDAAKRNFQRGVTDFGLYEIGLVTRPISVVEPARSAAVETTTALVETTATKQLVPPVGARPDDQTLKAIHASIPDQPRQVAGVLVGNFEPGGWWGGGRQADWNDALGLVQRIADRANVAISVNPLAPAGPTWHPGRSAVLIPAGKPEVVLGIAGELHPKVAKSYGLPLRTVAFEVNLTALDQAAGEPVVKATPVSAYPVAKEDFAFVVPVDQSAQDVETAIRAAAGDLLESVELFDIFAGPQLGEGRKSLAYSVRLRAADRTLTDDDVKATRENIIAAAQNTGATLRT